MRALFIGRGRGSLACGPRKAAAARAALSTRDRVPVAHGVEEDPDRWGHPVGVRGEGEGGAGRLAERGSWASWDGLRGEKLGREKKKRERREREGRRMGQAKRK